MGQRLDTASFMFVMLELQMHNYYVFELGTVTVPMHAFLYLTTMGTLFPCVQTAC
jgi:hypothetical protein